MPIEKTCEQCSKPFEVRPRDNDRRFCGQDCYWAYTAIHGRSHKKPEMLHFTCKKCGKPFSHLPGHVTSYRKRFGFDPMYCSRECGWVGKRKLTGRPCIVCGEPIPAKWIERAGSTPRSSRRQKICGPECRSKFKLAEQERRRPSDEREVQRNITAQGYVRLRFPNKDGEKGREVLEHRLVMEQHIGRELHPEETVHHKNGQRDQNTIDNLELFSSRHGPGQRVTDKINFAVEMIALYPEFLSDAHRSELAKALEHQAPSVSLV